MFFNEQWLMISASLHNELKCVLLSLSHIEDIFAQSRFFPNGLDDFYPLHLLHNKHYRESSQFNCFASNSKLLEDVSTVSECRLDDDYDDGICFFARKTSKELTRSTFTSVSCINWRSNRFLSFVKHFSSCLLLHDYFFFLSLSPQFNLI